MATAKIILRKIQNKSGLSPLALQIIENGRSSISHIGHAIRPDQWDDKAQKVRKNHDNHARLNNLIKKKLAEANDKILEFQAKDKVSSAQTIKNTIVTKSKTSFADQAQIYLDNLKKSGKFNRYSNDKPKITRVQEFAGDISFQDIDVPFLKKFQAWIKGDRGVSDRTVANHLVVIRTVFNQAIAAGVVERKHYPFGKGKVGVKFPDAGKTGLSKEELQALESADLKGAADHSRNLFLFSFYLAGMRASDVLRLRWVDIQDDRLAYTMGKNNKAGSLKIPAKAMAIIEQYPSDHELVFPDLQKLPNLKDKFAVQKRIKTRIRAANNQLKTIAETLKIEKKLTMHVSRHSFAQISADKVPVQILQKLYRHSSITTTIGYQSNFTNKDTDDALDSVLDF